MFFLIICGVGVDVYMHGFKAGVFIIICSALVLLLEIRWIITLFLQLLSTNESHNSWLQCWNCCRVFGGWRPSPLYIALGTGLLFWPHNLWLSYVAGALLILLALLRLCTVFKFSRNSKDEGLLPQCDFQKINSHSDALERSYIEMEPSLEDEEPIDDVC